MMLDLTQTPVVNMVKLLFVTAVESEDATVKRMVFRVNKDLYVVVKWFPDPDLITVKFWTVTGDGLKKTMSFWSTKSPWKPTADEMDAARRGVELVVRAAIAPE